MISRNHIDKFLKATSLLLCVLLAGACANDTDLGDVDSDMPICFTVENKETRAPEPGFTAFTGNDFGVTARWYADGDMTANPQTVIDNQKINYANGIATPASGYRYYWAKGGWHFSAYAPYIDPTANNNPMQVTVPQGIYGGYKFEGIVTGRTDYMFADEQAGYYNVAPATGEQLQRFTAENAVPMRFRHALTKVTFAVKLGDASSGKNTLTFSNVSIHNIRNNGYVKFAHDGVNNWVTKDDHDSATDGVWVADETSKTDYALASNMATINDEEEHMLEQVLYLMPQELVESGDNYQAFNVKYTLKIGDNSPTEKDITIPVYTAATPKWSINDHIHYTLKVPPPGGTVSLGVEVQPWELYETEREFADAVTVESDGKLRWTLGTYYSNDEVNNRLIILPDINNPAKCSFCIGHPKGSTWYAMLRSKRGNPSAFKLKAVENATESEGVVLGEVGSVATIEIVATDPHPTETNEAELIFIVICNGNMLSADVVSPQNKNYTIIQNINI